MHAGEDDDTGGSAASPSGDEAPMTPDAPPPPPPTPTTPDAPETPDTPDTPETRVEQPPLLPTTDSPTAPPSMMATVATPTRGGDTWYRTDQDRFRSVHRRANPWYRRLARGVIGLSFLAAAGIGLFFAARVVQDYLDRDRLPSQGAELPPIRSTSFELRSTAPAPGLDGTLTLDAATRAFEFIGRGTGSQAGVQIVSPDGDAMYMRVGTGNWERPVAGDQLAADVATAVSYLADDDSADDILTSQLRRGYVDLLDRTEVGTGDDELRRYELRLDTRSFESDFPLQYRQFADGSIPGVQAVRGLLVTITLDDDDVLVGVDDAGTNWSWQRLAYSDQPFTPLDPTDELLDSTIEITDGNVGDG